MRSLSMDIETFSSEDLAGSGVYRYAESPDFAVLLLGWSADGAPARTVDLARGEKVPEGILSALLDDTVEKWAFNANFERVCLSRYLRDMGLLGPGEFLSPAAWRCSMVWCGYLGLPMGLAGAGSALGLEKQKLSEGKDLIRLFCSPGRDGRRHMPGEDPERWQEFLAYNLRDVETECAIRQRLRHYPVPEGVWREYALDQAINDRGIRVDLPFVDAAVRMDEGSRRALAAGMREKTGLENPASVAQVRGWLEARGVRAGSLGKKEVAAMLEDAPPEIREVLKLRQQLAKSSVKKYTAMRNMACADGRLRGAFQFYGANRSGRWAGRGVQLQNLPRNHLEDLAAARELVRWKDIGTVSRQYDNVRDVLSELIRTAFVPEAGKKFIVADFSAVEARVLSWLAGESWRTEVFASGGDIYCESASRMFRVPVEKYGPNAHLRQKGKVAELALGYGGGVGALRAMGALEMGVPEGELQGLVTAWRSANPRICRFWWDTDRAVRAAVRERTTVRQGLLEFTYRSGMLFISLPSGRSLAYVRPRLEENAHGGSVTYMGVGPSKKWERIGSYGPKFTENIVQGIARDLLAEAMLRLEGAGYRIAAHVHDEVIVEADPGDSVEDVCVLMGRTPSCAPGLVLRADGYECEFYRKE